MEEVKIIYCYDENFQPIHYSKTIKGDKYYCIDCGSELVCKDGKKKIKHLAHKNTENCGGTGESIFHKHWKENLFKAGMFINVANRISDPDNVEILDVLNEVSLNKRYDKRWDIEIIVDTLLVTEKGDIIVEINYKNPKDWNKLKPYYEELDLLRVFEVKVDKNVNTTLEWFCLGEEEEIEQLKKQKIAEEKRKRKEKEDAKKEKARLKEEEKFEQERKIQEFLKNGTYKEHKVFFNFKTKIQKFDENTFIIHTLSNTDTRHQESIKLKFNLHKVNCKENKLFKSFSTNSGIKYRYVIVNNSPDEHGCHEVISFGNVQMHDYDNRLFAKLCNL